MSTIQDIRIAMQAAIGVVDRALPALGYNDLVAIFDDAEKLFAMIATALEANRPPEPAPVEVAAADAAADAAELAKFGATEPQEQPAPPAPPPAAEP